MTHLRERRIELEGAHNFRDLGGYEAADGRTIRWGSVYRSDRLAHLTDADHGVLGALGLGLVCDLRSDDERAEKPNRVALQAPPRVRNIPVEVQAGGEMEGLLLGGERDLARLRGVVIGGYREFVHVHRASWAALFGTLLAARSGSVVMHCSAGQDRTGFASALLLLALGVSRSVVVDDYMLTARYRPGWVSVEDIDPGPVSKELLVEIWRPGPDLLEASFDAMESGYGSVDGYLAAIGVDDTARERLRSELLD